MAEHPSPHWDVVVVGGGNAALCAALSAAESGARVLMLESAPEPWRGGNSVHTRNIRCMHEAPEDAAFTAQVEAGVLDPWNALAEHRPLGDVMRARKAVYYASQQERSATAG